MKQFRNIKYLRVRVHHAHAAMQGARMHGCRPILQDQKHRAAVQPVKSSELWLLMWASVV